MRTADEVEDFDLSSCVFTGTEMLQKFTNKSSYDKRCISQSLPPFRAVISSLGLCG